MSEKIPADIMAAANECVAQFRWNNDNRWHLFVARALLEERKRCASAYMHWARKMMEEVEGRKNDDA